MGLQALHHGKFDPKREVHTLKGIMTLTDYKSLFIYTHFYLQALIQVPSVTIQWNGCIPAGICGASKSTVRLEDALYIVVLIVSKKTFQNSKSVQVPTM